MFEKEYFFFELVNFGYLSGKKAAVLIAASENQFRPVNHG